MVFIYVEGKEDIKLIEAIIQKHIKVSNKDYKVNHIGGYTNLRKFKAKFNENKDFGHKSLVVFDSDFSSNNGGFSERCDYLLSLKEELNIDFELFLFPNNKDDGALEDLLENIILPEHKKIIECFNRYEECIKSKRENYPYNVPIQKSKIYAYIDTIIQTKEDRKKLSKGDKSFDNEKYWDLDSSYLSPLIDFLKEHMEASL